MTDNDEEVHQNDLKVASDIDCGEILAVELANSIKLNATSGEAAENVTGKGDLLLLTIRSTLDDSGVVVEGLEHDELAATDRNLRTLRQDSLSVLLGETIDEVIDITSGLVQNDSSADKVHVHVNPMNRPIFRVEDCETAVGADEHVFTGEDNQASKVAVGSVITVALRADGDVQAGGVWRERDGKVAAEPEHLGQIVPVTVREKLGPSVAVATEYKPANIDHGLDSIDVTVKLDSVRGGTGWEELLDWEISVDGSDGGDIEVGHATDRGWSGHTC